MFILVLNTTLLLFEILSVFSINKTVLKFIMLTLKLL